ncbi:MAG: CARDB domain-containing protein [Candidatus Cloacimonetes bacterium]|nr:CARDB domain-containing protein [Candidatus Cloacimonadota bacterium]
MKHHLLCLFFLLFIASSGALTYWTGAVSTDWHNASNWTAGVPTNATHAMIQVVTNGRYPDTTPSIAVCQRLSLLTGASVTVGTGGLWVAEYALIWGQVNLSAASDFKTGQSLTWLEGATVNVTDASAEIYCGSVMEFAAGSNVQFAMGYIEFSNTSGTDNYLKNNSASTILPTVRSRNSSGGIFYLHGDTSEDIVVNGNFHNYQNCSFQCGYDVNLIVKGNFEDDNTTVGRGVWLTHGTLVMDGITQAIELTPLSMLNNLTCSSSNSLNLIQDLFLRGTLTIASGVFDPGSWGIRIRGDWVNLVGPAAFDETGTTVTFEADWDQHCNYDEDFDALVVNKVAGYFIVDSSIADVNCFSYEWIDGGIKVLAGSFSALSLVNNYIAGEWFLQSGGTIELSNYGDASFIDLGGSLNISGGIFNIYGGADNSWWPYPSDASITMSGGTLDFKNQGVLITSATNSLTANISGGTIRVAGSFTVNRAGFLPGGGTIVLAGSADCQISHVAGSSFFSLDINKYLETETGNLPRFETDREGNVRELTRSQIVTAASNLDINGSFFQRAGYFVAPAQMNVRGNWYKYTGHDSFTEGTGKVVFDGAANSTVYGEEDFNDLELAKTSLAWEFRVPLNSEADCDSYDWTQGTLEVSGGLFYAHEMVDDVIQGEVNLSSGTIILVQDTANTLGLRGQLNISGGELHIWGGEEGLVTAMPSGGDAGLTMSNGLLYRHGWGIGIYNNAYTLSENITGGIIRTDGNFYCDRADFTPADGQLILSGSTNSYLSMVEGTLHGLLTSKPDAWVKMMTNVTANGSIILQTGILDLNARTLYANGGVVIHGTLYVDHLAFLCLGNMKYLNVESGGLLQSWGEVLDLAVISTETGFFYLNVRDGGTISARHCLFSHLSQYGLYIWPGGSIDPLNSFWFCEFSSDIPGGTLLRIDNSDNVKVMYGGFYTDAGGGATNVTKTVDAGMVNFVNALGPFSGEDFDADPTNRVFWNPGLDIPDLQILRAEWIPATPEPWLGDSRDLKVTVVNNSVFATTEQFYLDLYFDRDTAPPLELMGDEDTRLIELPAGLPTDVIFTGIANYNEALAGPWDSWLQIDTDAEVTESNEDNNIYGPFHITWLQLPAIDPLAIAYDPISELATLSWNYPLNVTRFNVYCDTDPYGDFSTQAGWSTTHSYSFSPGPNLFFRVTAERLPPLKTGLNPPRAGRGNRME